MTRTTAGKVELAQMMIQAGLVKTPDQMLQVIQTGNLDPLIEGRTIELLAIKAENESLVEGLPVSVMITDEHKLHILEHKATISDPAVREDSMVVQSVTEHIMEHFRFLSDPAVASLLTLLGQEPIQTTPQLGGAPVQGANLSTSTNELVQQMQPNQPSMPTNPLTNEQAPSPV